MYQRLKCSWEIKSIAGVNLTSSNNKKTNKIKTKFEFEENWKLGIRKKLVLFTLKFEPRNWKEHKIENCKTRWTKKKMGEYAGDDLTTVEKMRSRQRHGWNEYIKTGPCLVLTAAEDVGDRDWLSGLQLVDWAPTWDDDKTWDGFVVWDGFTVFEFFRK